MLKVLSPKATLYNPPARPNAVYPSTIYLMLQFIHTFIILIIKLWRMRWEWYETGTREEMHTGFW
jgi:hypothetical protein